MSIFFSRLNESSLPFHRGKLKLYLHHKPEREFHSMNRVLPWLKHYPNYPVQIEKKVNKFDLINVHKPHPKVRIVFQTFLKIQLRRFDHHVNKLLLLVLHLDGPFRTKIKNRFYLTFQSNSIFSYQSNLNNLTCTWINHTKNFIFT